MQRPALGLSALVVATLSLSGCDVLAPTRDAGGAIVGAVEMPSTAAWVGDCFTFVEGTDLAMATIVPCGEPHTHLVIGTGTFTERRIAHFDTLQLAVVSACEDRVARYLASAEGDPTPEYIVGTTTGPDDQAVTRYSCLIRTG